MLIEISLKPHSQSECAAFNTANCSSLGTKQMQTNILIQVLFTLCLFHSRIHCQTLPLGHHVKKLLELTQFDHSEYHYKYYFLCLFKHNNLSIDLFPLRGLQAFYLYRK